MKNALLLLMLASSSFLFAQDSSFCAPLAIQDIGEAYMTLNAEFDSLKEVIEELQEVQLAMENPVYASQSGPTTFQGDTIGPGIELAEGRTYLFVVGGGGFGWTYSGCCFAANATLLVHSDAPGGLSANVHPSGLSGHLLWRNSPCWTHYPQPSKNYFVQSLEDQTIYLVGKRSTNSCMTGGSVSVLVMEL